jgi:uncharacterized protein (UPF0261 family)
MATVVLLGTLDTKGREYAFVRGQLATRGIGVLVIDAGVYEPLGLTPDISRFEVARAAGTDIDTLVRAGDRGRAVTAMGQGAAAVVLGLHAQGRLDGVLALGGSGGSSIAARAMQALPVGVPKLLASTLASGDTRPYVGAVDITMMYTVVDISGINQISARILANAAGAIAGMIQSPAVIRPQGDRPLLAVSMFGVTTPCVTAAREWLEEHGFEVLVFHQTGTGGQSMEELVRAGFIRGVLDVTTTELADELVGGVMPAYPGRLEAAGAAGLPQAVSLGALDMVNFGPRATVPERFADRTFYIHNPTVTLMRTTADECAQLGLRLAEKLNAAAGATAVFVPLKGVSQIDAEGQPFHDPEADAALFRALRDGLADTVELHELDLHINDPAFAAAMAARLDELVRGAA